MLTRVADVRAPWEAEAEAVPVALFGAVVGPAGLVDLAAPGAGDPLAAECPMAHELLRSERDLTGWRIRTTSRTSSRSSAPRRRRCSGVLRTPLVSTSLRSRRRVSGNVRPWPAVAPRSR